MTSTPVHFSKVRMLRPSRPMLRGVTVDGRRQDTACLLLATQPQIVLVFLNAGGDHVGEFVVESL
jgi:hypothetical protein